MRNPIDSKEKLKQFIEQDSSCIRWEDLSLKEKIVKYITKDNQYYILLYLKYMRIDEYLEYTVTGFLGHVRWMLNRRKKNRLGHMLDLDIYSESFDYGLKIFHGGIIVHPSAKFGKNCSLHGHNCIGNNGKSDQVPCGGNNVDVGIGACIIGNIQISDNVVIGANAVVNKSIKEKDGVYIGVPAKLKYSK